MTSPGTRPVLLAAALLLAGCDIPTDLPAVETRWIVPADETRFGVDELLPGAVTLTPDSSAFLVDFDPVGFSETLAGLCPACVAAEGLTVPKPPFLATFASQIDFPSSVSSISVVSGRVDLRIDNGLTFDPLRPAASATGSVTIEITDSADGDLLGSLTVDGAATALPPGGVLLRSIVLSAASVEGSLVASVTVDSPLGDPVLIDSSLTVGVVATPGDIVVSSVAIDVGGESVNFDPVNLDVEDIDPELADRIVDGGFQLDVVNPFGVSASFQIAISGPTISTIQKSSTIGAAPTSTVNVAFTGAELRSFLGQPGVVLTGGADVDPSAGIITVTPGQELVLTGKFDLTLRIGG